MAQEIRLPKLGDTMEEASIIGCRVKPGDEIRRGDAILDIETDKAVMELESPAEGFVKAILVEAGQTVPVGTPLIVLGAKDESYSRAEPMCSPSRTQPAPQAAGFQPPSCVAGATVSAPHYHLGQKIPTTPRQKDIAQQMLRSKREIPCFYLNLRVDVTELVAFRQKLNQNADVKVAFNDLVVFAMAKALRQYPIMTGQLAGDHIELAADIGIGLAIAMPDGYVVPILKDVDKKSITQIAVESKSLIERAHADQLSSADFEGGCITVSNLGAFGVESFIPIVIPGQCSILGIGKIMEICVPINNAPTICKSMNMTLAVDHKVANGAYAAQFLEFLKKLLEDTAIFS